MRGAWMLVECCGAAGRILCRFGGETLPDFDAIHDDHREPMASSTPAKSGARNPTYGDPATPPRGPSVKPLARAGKSFSFWWFGVDWCRRQLVGLVLRCHARWANTDLPRTAG